MTEPEIPLTGGTLNDVVRVGDTVRRPTGPWSPTIHSLLRHVRSRGFELAPEPLGFDERGREILSYTWGEVVGWNPPWPATVRSDDLLRQVGQATARYHRAVADFRPGGTIAWHSGPARIEASEIVCHHDLAPYNCVVADGRLAQIIDWDLAGPGTATSELAFVAWQWVPLHGPFITEVLGWDPGLDRARRLRLLLDAYGLDDRAGFIDAVAERIRFNRELMLRRAREGDAAYRQLVAAGHPAGMDEGLAFLAIEGPRLQAEIDD